MRPLLPALGLTLGLLLGAALAAIPEGEPNDDPDDPGYAGDVGELGAAPIVVEGTVASYGPAGDEDYHRFQVATRKMVSVSLAGYQGAPSLALLDASGAQVGTGALRGLGFTLVPGQEIGPGTFLAALGGASGPDDDSYALTIRELAEGALTIRKAKARYNLKKANRDSVSVLATYVAPDLDPAADGLLFSTFGIEDLLAPGILVEKRGKAGFKGPKTSPRVTLKVDFAKSEIKLSLKNANLGPPGFTDKIGLHLESGGTSLGDEVVATVKKRGRLLTYKAPR